MKKLLTFILVIVSFPTFASFQENFINRTLRIDMTHAGDFHSDEYFLEEVIIEPYWGGSQVNLLDTFNYGQNYVRVFDFDSEELLYSRGYSTLFGEWQTTAEAKLVKRSFSESVVIPLPIRPAKIVFFGRARSGTFVEKFRYDYRPENYFIKHENRLTFSSFDVLISGTSEKKVDIVILPEGYNESEMGVFISDCHKFAETLFTIEPYSNHKDKFNIRGILAPSPESGTDVPADTTWRKTLMGTSFYTFDSERYCMTYDNKSVRDLAANAPYDQIYILVNSTKYGGGAIYNYYSVSVNSNLHAAKIFVHEFGHGFAGLADEYYMDDVAYSDFYPLNVEPWEPNLTTLVNFPAKWKDMLGSKTQVPTPNEPKYYSQPGVFEGGGYAAKGVYRPAHDCLMNTFKGNEFCPVCKRAIEKMILFYSE
jgi:hypothetical protein